MVLQIKGTCCCRLEFCVWDPLSERREPTPINFLLISTPRLVTHIGMYVCGYTHTYTQ